MTFPRTLDPTSRRRPAAFALAFLLLAGGWLLGDRPATVEAKDERPATAAPWTGRWSEGVLDLVATIPVQSQGRIKPLHTWAGFTLLGMNHRRSCKTADDTTISALEWWMDAVFRPSVAKSHHCFLIQTTEILDAVGLTEEVRERRKLKKRDRYSYNDLVSDRQTRLRIDEKARVFHEIDSKNRSRVEEGVVELANSLSVFEGLNELVAFARFQGQVDTHPALKAAFGGRARASFTEILEKSPVLASKVNAEMETAAGHGDAHGGKAPLSEEAAAFSELLNQAFNTTQRSIALGLFPPGGGVESEAQWFGVRDVAGFAMLRSVLDPVHMQALRALEGMATSVGQQAEFWQGLRSYHDTVRTAAERRGEYGEIEREVAFYELDPFGKSLVYYLIAFALLGITWLAGGRLRWLEILAWVLLWGTLALHTYGIVQRCLIRDRPPISTLYETVVFITATGVLSLLLIEHINRRRVALGIAPIVGALGLFIAARYEVLKGTDTMPQLVAVLDTNFWLTTHVTAISIGYCAGLVAALIAHVYVLGKVFRFKAKDQAFYRSVGKMVYGTLCFALLFSLVGTILGGIWANDSWGRFWGWDPKENGALLICISQLAILHGRMGGIFKTFGVCQAAILGGVVVAFSWWGVNLLGVGLHSYGFTSGIWNGLMIFYGVEAAVMGAGLYAWLRDRPAKKVASGV